MANTKSIPAKTGGLTARNNGAQGNGNGAGKSNDPGKTSKNNNGNTMNAGTAQGNSQLEEFFIGSLKDLYWAEKHLTKALPKMQKAATTEELKAAIGYHLTQTETHVTRLEQVFEIMGKKAQAKKCDAMEGLVKEGESIVEETEEGSMTRDTGIIMAAQKVEHYEISSYSGMVRLAKMMGQDEAANLLEQTLEEEIQTDEGLTEIAEGSINWAAEQDGEGDDEEER